jgi:hypothetical protein
MTLVRRFALLVVLFSPPVLAGETGYTFHVIPDTPQAGQPLQIRIVTEPNMCVPLPADLEVQALDGNVVRYNIVSSDGCEPPNIPAEDRVYSVPSLPAGTYTFRFFVCGLQPTDESPDGCSLLEELSVSVLGVSGRRVTVPTLSGFVAILAVLAMLGAAWIGGRRA